MECVGASYLHTRSHHADWQQTFGESAPVVRVAPPASRPERSAAWPYPPLAPSKCPRQACAVAFFQARALGTARRRHSWPTGRLWT